MTTIRKHFFVLMILSLSLLFAAEYSMAQGNPNAHKLSVSSNKRLLVDEKGQPFFWLGDTGWLLFAKLTREEADKYLEDRKRKGFNVIQVMLVHDVRVANAYGDSALANRNVATPDITPGSSFSNDTEYDYWDHVDYIISRAAEKGIYMALVPIWGTNVKNGWVKENEAKIYASYLAERYKNRWNIIWLNGGDIKGTDGMNVWKAMGNTINTIDTNHLISFHPFGRTTSSAWFHNEPWLDFNMFQSGHRSYEQDTSAGENKFGPDNYKFVLMDYAKEPAKPTLDGEPSYEYIPYGLHDTTQPRWTAADVRRYGYWEVFAGGAGYTYGHNSVMQMRKPGDKEPAYGSKRYWFDAINDPGAQQMIYLKKLMLSRSYLERVPDQSLLAGENGTRYDYQVATRGKNYAYVYTYNGRSIRVNMGKINGAKLKASWYDPRTGKTKPIGVFTNKGVQSFDPPGIQQDGNDWVLILEKL